MSNQFRALAANGQAQSPDELKNALRPLFKRHVRDTTIDPLVIYCYATAKRHREQWGAQEIEAAISDLLGGEARELGPDEEAHPDDRGWKRITPECRPDSIERATFEKARKLAANLAFQHRTDRKKFVAAVRRQVPKVAEVAALSFRQRRRLLYRLLRNQWPTDAEKPLYPSRYALRALKKGGRRSGTTRKGQSDEARERAIELFQKGKAPSEIAKQVGTTKRTVNRWVQPYRDKVGHELSKVADKTKASTAREAKKSTTRTSSCPTPTKPEQTPPPTTPARPEGEREPKPGPAKSTVPETSSPEKPEAKPPAVCPVEDIRTATAMHFENGHTVPYWLPDPIRQDPSAGEGGPSWSRSPTDRQIEAVIEQILTDTAPPPAPEKEVPATPATPAPDSPRPKAAAPDPALAEYEQAPLFSEVEAVPSYAPHHH